MPPFSRYRFQPVRPLGKNHTFVTACAAHQRIALQGAVDGTVLLKNDGVLPLAAGTSVCMFGSGTGEFLFGGGGSGNICAAPTPTLGQALAQAAEDGKIRFFTPLLDFYEDFTKKEYADALAAGKNISYWRRKRNIRTPELPEELYTQAKAFGDTAIFCISRYSSEGTDCGDRNGLEGDFDLWGNELVLLQRLYADFRQVVVVLNVCGPVSVTESKPPAKPVA